MKNVVKKILNAFSIVEWCFVIGIITVIILAEPLGLFSTGWFKSLLRNPFFWIVIGSILLTLIIINRKTLFKKSTAANNQKKVAWSKILTNFGTFITILFIGCAGFYLFANGKLAWFNATKPYKEVEADRARQAEIREGTLSKKPKPLNFVTGKWQTYYKDSTYYFILGSGKGSGLSAALENPATDYNGFVIQMRKANDPAVGLDATFDKEGNARASVRKEGFKGGDTMSMKINKDIRMVTYVAE